MARHRIRPRTLRLKELRFNMGLTQSEVEETTGLSRGYLTQIESGRRGGLKTLWTLAQFYEVPIKEIADLHDGDGDGESKTIAS